MALIKLTAIVDNISGKLNGTVFARNKGGHYMRSKSNPTNPQTFFQMSNRGAFGAIATAWRNLTQAQRSGWDGAAPDFPYQNRLGDTKILSGFNLFQKLNRNLILAGAPFSNEMNSAPTPAAVTTPTFAFPNFGVDPDETGTLFEIDADVIQEPGSHVALLYVTPPMSAGISNFKNRLRLLHPQPVPAGSNSVSFNITQPYIERFGVPEVGSKIGVAVRIVNMQTGQASVEVSGANTVYEVD